MVIGARLWYNSAAMEDHMLLSEMPGDTQLDDMPDDEPWDATGKYTLDDVKRLLKRQHERIQELKDDVRNQTAERHKAEAEARDLREQLHREGMKRPSLEVLQRMANGLDPFDLGRFKCAMAALPHEAPKLSATVTMFGHMGIGDRLDRVQARRPSDRLRLVENGAESASE